MDRPAGKKGASHSLYPPIEPFDQRILDVGDGHRVYVEQCGAPDGAPVVVLHGGPGGGCSPAMRRYFDPSHYRVILFDQRGCGRSKPHASVEHNTTWHLVSDIEQIRDVLGIDRWVVFGGSWGATLALIYAIQHPDRVRHLMLRGVFLMTDAELRWFYGGGAGAFWPDVWRRFVSLIPPDERDDLIAAYARRLFSGDLPTETRYARAWASWENTLASIANDGPGGDSPAEYARAFSRLCRPGTGSSSEGPGRSASNHATRCSPTSSSRPPSSGSARLPAASQKRRKAPMSSACEAQREW